VERAISIVVYDPVGHEPPGTTYPPGSVWMLDKERETRRNETLPKLTPVARREELRNITRHRRECVVCGRTFYSKRSDAKYHSPACRHKAHYRRPEPNI
jgi:hypothetical protein